jgi:uncharacterized membrane protein YbhN (UPF0104 family)
MSALVAYAGPNRIAAKLLALDTQWIWLTLLSIPLATLLGCINLYILLTAKNRIGFISFLEVYWLSWAIGLIAPGQVGDLATISLALQKRGIKISIILGRSILDKLISLAVMLCISIYALHILVNPTKWTCNFAHWPVVFFGVVLVGLLCSIRLKSSYTHRSPRLQRFLDEVCNTANEVTVAIKTSGSKILLNGLLTSVKVSLIGLAYWAMFVSLGYKTIHLQETTAFATLAGLAAYIPISLNGFGTVEALSIPLFGYLGIHPADVLAAYLGLRFIVLALAWIPILSWALLYSKHNLISHKHEQRPL